MMLPLVIVLMSVSGVGASASASGVTNDSLPVIDRMPAPLETRFALSALPRPMREHATVYLLDPRTGYHLAQQGTSGVTCLVQRTDWEASDYRSDIWVPRCYDAEGSRTLVKVLMDAAALRARGMPPAALKTEIVGRYRRGRYTAPARSGLSYMISPVMRTFLDGGTVQTISGPHVMFYAPNVTNKDIGAMPDSLPRYPFTVREGIAEQTFILQMLGERERSTIVTEEHDLLTALCEYRASLCLRPPATAPPRLPPA